MKITAGMGRADDYDLFCDAGADELFCGYVPERWAELCGSAMPLNRREVRYVGVQLGGRGDLLILRDRIARRGVPVALTFNAPCYAPALYPLLGEIITQCIDDGYDRFIIADPALLVWLNREGLTPRMHIHLSGECGILNPAAVRWAARLGAERIILHRMMSADEIAQCTSAMPGIACEAFILNELCHFHGGFCQSLHCDELPPMCRVPWRAAQLEGDAPAQPQPPETDPGVTGAGGCGLCAIPSLQRAGVEWLKVVGRGAFTDQMISDIRAVRTAISLSQSSADDRSYRTLLMRTLFRDGCSRRCYYPEETP